MEAVEPSTDDFLAAVAEQARAVGSLAASVAAMQDVANSTAQQIHKQAEQWTDDLDHEPQEIVAATPQPRPRPATPPPSFTPRPLVDRSALAQQAIDLVAHNVEGWNRVSDRVLDRVVGNDAIDRAFATGNAGQVAGVLAGMSVAEKQLADSRQMKLQSQTMVGAGGRLEPGSDDQQEWAKIMNAGDGGYSARKAW